MEPIPIRNWIQLIENLNELKNTNDNWIFRGQSHYDSLKTSLERALDDYGICLNRAPEIEEQLIRDFQRRYQGPDLALVLSDTLYCLSLMRHHGAPTRLLDWTYSPYAAAFFALEEGLKHKGYMWCLNEKWISDKAKSIAGDELIGRRNQDVNRCDNSFRELYINRKNSKPYQIVFAENPFMLNERLIVPERGISLSWRCIGELRI